MLFSFLYYNKLVKKAKTIKKGKQMQKEPTFNTIGEEYDYYEIKKAEELGYKNAANIIKEYDWTEYSQAIYNYENYKQGEIDFIEDYKHFWLKMEMA